MTRRGLRWRLTENWVRTWNLGPHWRIEIEWVPKGHNFMLSVWDERKLEP